MISFVICSRAIDKIEGYQQHMNLGRGFAIQISSRGSLMTPTMRSKRSQIGTEAQNARFLLHFPESTENGIGGCMNL
jgi:hypothetical protein